MFFVTVRGSNRVIIFFRPRAIVTRLARPASTVYLASHPAHTDLALAYAKEEVSPFWERKLSVPSGELCVFRRV